MLRCAPLAFSFIAAGLAVGSVAARAESSTALAPAHFSPASAAVGDTLFTRLDAARTGISVQNPYDDPRMWGKRYREFMGGGLGSGLAAGDFDGDGKVDLYVSTKTTRGRLYKNLGAWKFADITEDAGVAEESSVMGWLRDTVASDKNVVWHQGAVFADVNNDARLDLYVCRNNAPNLLFINRGDGTFQEEAAPRGLALVDGSVVGAFADYDRDGWLDVFIVTNQVDGTEPGGRPDRLYRNTGDGHFVEVTTAAGIAGPTFGHSATWIDYDTDGWPDLYVANDFSGPDRFYRNNRDGTFTDVLDAVAPHTPFSSMGADLADIDNDGHFDLFVADMATTTREKDRRGLAASREDVLNMAAKAGVAPQYMRNALLLNTGRGNFGEAACWAGIAATDWTWSVRFEDFDNDGWADLHVTNGMVREPNNTDLLAQMMRALSDHERIAVMKRSPPLHEANLAYRNLQGTGFEPVANRWGLGEVGVSFGAATADWDNDGDLDLAYINYDGGVSVFRNDISGPHRVQVRLRGTRSNRFGVGAVVRVQTASTGLQSQTLTTARGYASGSDLVAHFGLGRDDDIKQLVVEWPSGIRQVFADLKADAVYTVTENGEPAAPERVQETAVFRAEAARLGLKIKDTASPVIPDSEQVFLPFRTDRRGPPVAVGDIDGDGREEIFLGATSGSPARLLRWNGGTYVAEAPSGIATAQIEDGPVLLVDFDGDGTRDVLVTKASAQTNAWPQSFQPVIYANDGRGHFTATQSLPSLAINVGSACAADIDGDGDLDLFLGARSIPGRYPEAPASVLLRNNGGRFVEITDRAAELAKIGLVKSALFRDVDRDGRPDLIVALEWDFVRYLHNDGDARFSDWTEKAGFTSGGRGWWNALACADLNGDGQLDFAAGNLGWNTTYRASPSRPAILFHGDFARNGTKLLAEAVHDGGKLYPVRGRADLGGRLPHVLRRFPRNDDFARADIVQVFGEDTLGTATRYSADNFSSGVFLSGPDGTYRFQPFPPRAQIGPIQGTVAADLDGDGHVDICAIQNSDTAIPRFHGGVGIFLRGRSDGAFAALATADSGIVLPGNGRALALFDANGDARPDLFSTEHGGETELLANRAAESRWLSIALENAAKNPDAIGAKVQLAYANGARITYEIGCGGGWLTQSTARIFAAIPAGQRLVAAVVTWPDGRHSRHADVPAEGKWTLRPPAR